MLAEGPTWTTHRLRGFIAQTAIGFAPQAFSAPANSGARNSQTNKTKNTPVPREPFTELKTQPENLMKFVKIRTLSPIFSACALTTALLASPRTNATMLYRSLASA